MRSVNTSFRQVILAVLSFFLLPVIAVAGVAPTVTNVMATQRENSFIVDITYDLTDADSDSLWVRLYFSPDGGATWPVLCTAVSGDVGDGVSPGSGLSIEWNADEDLPGEILSSCSMRVTASDAAMRPYFDGLWKSDLGGGNELPLAYMDTLAFANPFRISWRGTAPSTADMDPAELALIDTVYPFDDGLLGYKYLLPNDNCLPAMEDCWQPRRFNEATGDSFSFWGANAALDFYNDGSGVGPLREILPSGVFALKLNTIDVFDEQVTDYGQAQHFVVNYDPQTIILNGETDWAHPEDPQVYPYYVRLNDPVGQRYPFQAGDRIPDRTYVVFKALARDDPRDGTVDGSYKVNLTGFMQGVRQNLFGGLYGFSTDAAVPNPAPTWDLGIDGWYADTLGFLTGPNTEFTMNMQGIDETGRRDGTPAKLSFDVGYPPCLQCIEILPNQYDVSVWPPDLACVEDPATHPCFQDTTVVRVVQNPIPNDGNLEYMGPVVMLVDKSSYAVQIELSNAGYELSHYSIPANRYLMSVLLHGVDDPRDAWSEPVRRAMGWRYQVDYECDPYNLISDGGGNDDIVVPTWGEPGSGDGLTIDPASGLWRLDVEIVVPQNLFMGSQQYEMILRFVHAGQDEEIAAAIFAATTRQFGNGGLMAVMLDQTACGFMPTRPGKYYYFKGVRPPISDLPTNQTWRDCNLIVPDVKGSLDLSLGAMSSLAGSPATKYFRIILETNTGDFTCELSK